METACEAKFGDGEYRFWLPLPQIFELERLCDTSILAIEERLRGALGQDAAGNTDFIGGGDARVQEVRETIRLGLIGGNHGLVDGQEVEVGPLRAKQLADLYCYPARPLSEAVVMAWLILSSAIFGVRLKKKEPEPVAVKKAASRSAKGS